ncbi:hypothetical protein F8564_01420 [Serratia sp. RJAL6]|nr:hypothetical protein F8564_01420 [Enterobacter sp. RJAL6]
MIGFTAPTHRPAKPTSRKATLKRHYAVGVVPPEAGRISALAACKGAYGRVLQTPKRHHPQRHLTF